MVLKGEGMIERIVIAGIIDLEGYMQERKMGGPGNDFLVMQFLGACVLPNMACVPARREKIDLVYIVSKVNSGGDYFRKFS